MTVKDHEGQFFGVNYYLEIVLIVRTKIIGKQSNYLEKKNGLDRPIFIRV